MSTTRMMLRVSHLQRQSPFAFSRLFATQNSEHAATPESAMERLAEDVGKVVQQESSSPIASTSNIPAPHLSQEVAPSHEAKHGFHVATLQFRSYTSARSQLDMAVEFARRAAYALKIPCGRPASLPTTSELITVPKGPFVHKKSQENFWRRTHRRAVKVWDADEQSVQVWTEYLRQNPVPGVGIKVQQFLYRPVGYGNDIQEAQTSDFVKVDAQEQQAAPKPRPAGENGQAPPSEAS